MISEHYPGELQPLSTTSEFRGVRFTTRIIPARGGTLSGDWCEAFFISEDIVALSIGDVCGHGDDAFETMLLTREAIRAGAGHGNSPVATLAHANQYLCEERLDRHVTATFALLDTRDQTLTFANAGHPPPLIANFYEAHVLECGVADLPLGLDPNATHTLHTVKIHPETLLVLYTDGVVENEHDAILGQRQLCDAAVFAYRCAGLAAAPVIEKQMLRTGSNFDDAAILTARMPLRAPRGAR